MRAPRRRPGESGFTLVETIIAMLVFMIGIVAIANLFVVALRSNVIANQTTAATAQAAEVADRLKAVRFSSLQAGGDLDGDDPSLCDDDNKDCVVGGTFNAHKDVAGLGAVTTRWTISAVDVDTLFITIRSETWGGRIASAEFTTFRSCTNADVCP